MFDCGFTKENNWFRYRAAAIIVENGCVLLATNDKVDYFYSVGGGVKMGEKAEDAVVREVFEETGLKICIVPGFVKKSEYTIQGKIEKSVSIFLAETDETDYKLQEEEIEECGWFAYSDALRILNYENDKYILTEAKKFLETAEKPEE